MKILTLCLLAASASVSLAQAPSTTPDLESRQFDHVRFGMPVSELPFPCHIMCEGMVGTHWFKINEKDHKVAMFTVVYNAKKISGEPVASHTLELLDALRDHSYANSRLPFVMGTSQDSQGRTLAWLDLNLKIAYLEDPDDQAKGITQVVYCAADAPIFAHAHRSAAIDKLTAGEFSFISDPPK